MKFIFLSVFFVSLNLYAEDCVHCDGQLAIGTDGASNQVAHLNAALMKNTPQGPKLTQEEIGNLCASFVINSGKDFFKTYERIGRGATYANTWEQLRCRKDYGSGTIGHLQNGVNKATRYNVVSTVAYVFKQLKKEGQADVIKAIVNKVEDGMTVLDYIESKKREFKDFPAYLKELNMLSRYIQHYGGKYVKFASLNSDKA